MPLITVCSPSKVLLTGGYLIIDGYNGLVVGLSDLFYCTIEGKKSGDINTASDINTPTNINTASDTKTITIHINSPQFTLSNTATITQSVDHTTQSVDSLLPLNVSTSSPNPFISHTLIYTLSLINHSIGFNNLHSLLNQSVITLLASNGFYSQVDYMMHHHLSICRSSLNHIPPFNLSLQPLDQVNKTGLGSSATMVTSIVGILDILY